MAADLGWMAGHTSCLDITLISILFLVVYIAFYTLCSSCFRETSEEKVQKSKEDKEIPSDLALSVNVDHWSTQRNMSDVDVVSTMAHSNMPQAPAGPQHETHAIVYGRQTNIYSHNRDKSDSNFSQQMTPKLPDTPSFSVRSTDSSMSPGLPALPPIPPTFYLTTVQVEPLMASSSGEQLKTVKPVWDSVTPPPEDLPNLTSWFTETVSEEHPYACIDSLSISKPSSPSSPGAESDDDRWESESPYHTVTEWTEPTTTCDSDTFFPLTDSENSEEPEFPAVQDDQPFMDTDRTAIYAVVNRKNKSQKSIEEAHNDRMVLDDDEAPPVPEKNI